MSHRFTRAEIDNAKIQVLQHKLEEESIPADVLYKKAIALLDGSNSNHDYEGDPNNADEQPPETEKLDG